MPRKTLSLHCLCAVLLAACATACMAADANNPWNGTWKLNSSKSKLTGAVDHVSRSSDGKWTVTTSGMTFSFACDDKEYPIVPGHSQVCHKVSDTEVQTVIKAGGQELAHVQRTLSDGGKTMTVVDTGKAPDGTPFHDTEIYKKVGAGDGWTGTWRSTKVQDSNAGVTHLEVSGGTLKMVYPMGKSTITARLDGTPTQEQSPHPTGIDISMKASGPRMIHEVDTLHGKRLEEDMWTVSPDGKTLTIEALRSGDPEKQLYVYDKQ